MRGEAVETIEPDENENIIHCWEPLEFDIDKNYEYVKQGNIFNIFSNFLYYVIAYLVLLIITKVIYNLKIEGKENLQKIKNGAVTVSNHVLFLDCAIIGIALISKKIYFTTEEGSFKIPFVRRLIKLLRAIPIPKDLTNKRNFTKEINKLLQEGRIVHFYPEAALWPYHNKIRNFKNGAFDFAVRNDVPVIPMVFKFRETEGIRRFFKMKPDITLCILEPIYAEKGNVSVKQKVENLKDKVHKKVEEEFEKK